MSENEPAPLLGSALKRWWLILLLTTLGAGAGYGVAKETPKQYQATATLVVGSLESSPNFSKDDVDASAALAQTYGALIRGPAVLNGVIEDLGLSTSWQKLQDQIHVDLAENGAP